RKTSFARKIIDVLGSVIISVGLANAASVVDGFFPAERAQYRKAVREALLQPGLEGVIGGMAGGGHNLYEAKLGPRAPCVKIARGAARRRLVIVSRAVQMDTGGANIAQFERHVFRQSAL